RALGERLVAVARDRAVVDKEVLASVVRGDESVPLRVVEPLHCSCRHRKTPPSTSENGRWEAFRRPVHALWSFQRTSVRARSGSGPSRDGAASGRVKATRAPPPLRFSAQIVPPCAWTRPRAIARPRPAPPLVRARDSSSLQTR